MNSPITPTVLIVLLLSLALAYCAGAFASGVWVALCLLASGIMATIAVFMEASAAYAAGVMDGEEEDV